MIRSDRRKELEQAFKDTEAKSRLSAGVVTVPELIATLEHRATQVIEVTPGYVYAKVQTLAAAAVALRLQQAVVDAADALLLNGPINGAGPWLQQLEVAVRTFRGDPPEQVHTSSCGQGPHHPGPCSP